MREDPAGTPTMEARMTSKADFTDEEWTRLKRAPFVAGMAISLADPGGPIEAVKETLGDAEDRDRAPPRAAAAASSSARSPRGRGGGAAAQEPARRLQAQQGRERAGVEILDELGGVNRIVSEKATPEDAAAVREWLLAAAQAAANAAKEGGFMGFHAERVSEGEQRMLDKLREVLTAP